MINGFAPASYLLSGRHYSPLIWQPLSPKRHQRAGSRGFLIDIKYGE